MIVNFTNHPCGGWSEEQFAAAERWGDIIDLSFPNVPAESDENDIAALADIYCSRICELNPDAVLIQGEMSLTYALIHRLRQSGIHVLCAASERVCTTAAADDGSVIRKSIFKFVRFREYC